MSRPALVAAARRSRRDGGRSGGVGRSASSATSPRGRARCDALGGRRARAPRHARAREAAVAALGALGDADALPAILDACGDKPAVRRRAVLALAPFDGPEVDAAIEAALTDRDWQVRQAAEDLRGSTGVGPSGYSASASIGVEEELLVTR